MVIQSIIDLDLRPSGTSSALRKPHPVWVCLPHLRLWKVRRAAGSPLSLWGATGRRQRMRSAVGRVPHGAAAHGCLRALLSSAVESMRCGERTSGAIYLDGFQVPPAP